MSGLDWTNAKQDSRPKRHGWAPGYYMNTCLKCEEGFIGDKRARTCADCAYAEPDLPMTTKTESLVERAKAGLRAIANFEDSIAEPVMDALAAIDRLEYERDVWKAKPGAARLTAPVGLETSEEEREEWASLPTATLSPVWEHRAALCRDLDTLSRLLRNDSILIESLRADLDTLSARLREAEEALEQIVDARMPGEARRIAREALSALRDGEAGS